MTSDNGGHFETLHWSGRFSRSFVSSYSDFLLIDSTHKTSISDLSLIVTDIVDSLGKSIPIGFLVAPSEHSDSITRHMKLLNLTRPEHYDPSLTQSRSIETDEGSALVKVSSNMDGYYHCFCLFRINQLAIRVSSQICLFTILQQIHIK